MSGPGALQRPCRVFAGIPPGPAADAEDTGPGLSPAPFSASASAPAPVHTPATTTSSFASAASPLPPMRTHASTALALATALAASAVVAQRGDYGDTTFLSRSSTYTAALDEDGDPIAPALATLVDVSTTTRTRGGNTIAVVYDSDEDPLFTSTVTAAAATTTTGRAPVGGAAGGGAGPVTTSQASLQKISGYTPPPTSAIPTPTAYSSGTIIQPNQIPGYSSFASSINKIPVDGRPIYGGGGNKVDSDSGTSPASTLCSSRWTTAAVLVGAIGTLALA